MRNLTLNCYKNAGISYFSLQGIRKAIAFKDGRILMEMITKPNMNFVSKKLISMESYNVADDYSVRLLPRFLLDCQQRFLAGGYPRQGRYFGVSKSVKSHPRL